MLVVSKYRFEDADAGIDSSSSSSGKSSKGRNHNQDKDAVEFRAAVTRLVLEKSTVNYQNFNVNVKHL